MIKEPAKLRGFVGYMAGGYVGDVGQNLTWVFKSLEFVNKFLACVLNLAWIGVLMWV